MATLSLILAVLVGVAWIMGELKTADQLRGELAVLVSGRDALVSEAEGLRRNAAEQSKHADVFVRHLRSILDKKRSERQKLWDEHFWSRKIPQSEVSMKIQFLEKEIEVSKEVADKVSRVKESAARELKTLIVQKERDIEQITAEIAGVQKTIDEAFVSQF